MMSFSGVQSIHPNLSPSAAISTRTSSTRSSPLLPFSHLPSPSHVSNRTTHSQYTIPSDPNHGRSQSCRRKDSKIVVRGPADSVAGSAPTRVADSVASSLLIVLKTLSQTRYGVILVPCQNVRQCDPMETWNCQEQRRSRSTNNPHNDGFTPRRESTLISFPFTT